jgi:hypothetical protein
MSCYVDIAAEYQGRRTQLAVCQFLQDLNQLLTKLQHITFGKLSLTYLYRKVSSQSNDASVTKTSEVNCYKHRKTGFPEN